MIARVRRWGNGLALRVRKKDLEAAGIEEGELVRVTVTKTRRGGDLDLESLPTFRDRDSKASVRHDRYLYG